MACEIDYDEQKRLAWQFRSKPSMANLIQAFIDAELDTANCDLLNKRGLDTAIGKQLDGIGEIVGLERPREPQSDSGYFGFLEDPDANGFSSLDNVTAGGYFTQLNPPLVVPIDDDKYRLAIKGKIFQNHTNMTVDETLKIMAIIFQTEIRYYLSSNLNATYTINKILRPYEEELLKQFPQTIGIGDVTFKSTVEDNGFGFDEDPTALGFTLLADDTVGGHFAIIN